METTLTVVKSSTDGGSYETFKAKMFLASTTEVGLANENNIAEGSLLALFSNDASRVAYPTAQCVNNADGYTNSGFATSKGWYWWLRTPNSSNACLVRSVYSVGSLFGSYAYYGVVGVRPLCNLKSSILVSDSPNSDGNYTVYRELKRGRYTHLNSDLTTEERYSPEIAQQRYEENLKAKGGELKIGNDYELSAFIEKKIGEEGYSPAAVVGEIKRLGLTFKTEISEKTIYNYIDKGIFYGISRESLPEHGERKRKYDKVERKKAARAPQGESIEERPQEINDRQTFGHWEGDCVCGKKRTKETLFVLSERLTRNEIIIKMPDQTAASVVAALNKLERRFGKKFSQIFKSITFDNGSEFMDCAGIEKSVYGKDRKRTKVYYCHPYSAYERGTNENINKMIRRFLPKGTDFRKVTAAYIQRVETWINNYPREILGFETSGSLFERYVAEAA